MQELKERILKEGKVLPGNIVKVDGFLNHRIDCKLMADIADEFAKLFDLSKVDLILTAEASGHRARRDLCLPVWSSDGLCQEGKERQHRRRSLPERDLFLHL